MPFRCVAVVTLAGAVLAASAGAFAADDTAWRLGTAPVEATGAFVVPAPDLAAAPDPLASLARYEDHSGGGIFNEVRLGVLGFWQDNSDSEEGIYVTGQVLFDPFLDPFANRFVDILLRPRPHIGGTASFDGTDQLFAGVTWTVPIWRGFFVEASFGGTIHNGPLEGAQVSLGCSVLFRESLGVGVDIGEHLRIMAAVDHSSHADLCDGENDGLTHLGGYIGYRF